MRPPLFLLILPFALIVGCGQERQPLEREPVGTPLATEPIPITPEVVIPDGEYTLRSMRSSPYQGHPVTLKVTDSGGGISGQAPVNTYHATLENGKVSAVALTRMAGPPERMRLEREFLDNLSDAELSITPDGKLAARKNGIAVLMFRPAEN